MGERWTVLPLLKASTEFLKSRGIDTARLDAEVLLAHLLGVDRITLYTRFDQPLGDGEIAAYRERIRRRGERVPVAYVLGEKEFWSLRFEVGPGCLVPRPDTETLVEVALRALPAEPGPEGSEAPLLLDLGTGPGTLAITLARERPIRAVGVESSAEALAFARRNAAALGVEARVGFSRGDWWGAVPARFAGRFAAVVSNPPYLPADLRPSLAPELLHEPEAALFPGPDPLLFYRRTLADLPRWLAPGGWLGFEVGDGQAPAVVDLVRRAGLGEILVTPDLAGRERVVSARRPV